MLYGILGGGFGGLLPFDNYGIYLIFAGTEVTYEYRAPVTLDDLNGLRYPQKTKSFFLNYDFCGRRKYI